MKRKSYSKPIKTLGERLVTLGNEVPDPNHPERNSRYWDVKTALERIRDDLNILHSELEQECE